MKGNNGTGEVIGKVIRCEIYAGENRIRSFPEDRSLQILKAFKRNGNALVLECVDARGNVVEVETTLPYLLIHEAPAASVHEARPTMEVQLPALAYAEVCGSA
jgi:hypothetical protein